MEIPTRVCGVGVEGGVGGGGLRQPPGILRPSNAGRETPVPFPTHTQRNYSPCENNPNQGLILERQRDFFNPG